MGSSRLAEHHIANSDWRAHSRKTQRKTCVDAAGAGTAADPPKPSGDAVDNPLGGRALRLRSRRALTKGATALSRYEEALAAVGKSPFATHILTEELSARRAARGAAKPSWVVVR